MTKVLITGATGFLGSHLVRAALAKNMSVRALARSTSDVRELEELGVELFTGDLTDASSLAGCCDGVDAVLHCAAELIGRSRKSRPLETWFFELNRDGTLNLANEVLRHGDLRMVHISSTAAMGTPRATHVDETTPTHPVSPYQVSKREAELALIELQRRENLNVVILRPCLVAGEGNRDGQLEKLFNLVKKGRFPLIGKNDQLRKPLIMVDDLAEIILTAIDRGRSGEIYLVHSGGDHTMGEIVEVAARLTGVRRSHVRIPLLAARAAAYTFKGVSLIVRNWNPPLTPERLNLFLTDRHIDISKARKELGFSPGHKDLDEMLGRTYRWLVKKGLV